MYDRMNGWSGMEWLDARKTEWMNEGSDEARKKKEARKEAKKEGGKGR